MRVSPVSRNGQPARKLTTTDFGVMEKVRYYDSIHYRNRLRWFQPLVPRQFYVNDVYYHQMRQRLPAWDELFLDLVYVAAFLQVGM